MAEARYGLGLRPLGLPREVRVRADADGVPLAVTLEAGRALSARRHARTLEVEEVLEVWRLAEGWWRESPVYRTYYRVAVDGGRMLTLFRDDDPREDGDRAASAGRWYEQRG